MTFVSGTVVQISVLVARISTDAPPYEGRSGQAWMVIGVPTVAHSQNQSESS